MMASRKRTAAPSKPNIATARPRTESKREGSNDPVELGAFIDALAKLAAALWHEKKIDFNQLENIAHEKDID
jgi:hypothetical protein